MINSTKKLLYCLGVLLLTAAGFSNRAKADEWNKKTVVTINEPVQVPNTILEPGTYVFKLLDSQSDRHIVQIFNQDETHLITTILAIPNYRLQPTGKTQLGFWETPAGQVSALRAWFYPGDNFGQEFAYPKTMAAQIAANNSNATVPVDTSAVNTAPPAAPPAPQPTEPAPAASAPAPAPSTAAVTPPQQPESAEPPAPAPTPSTMAENQQPAPSPELPHTASQLPLLMLGGLLSLVVFAALALKTKRAL